MFSTFGKRLLYFYHLLVRSNLLSNNMEDRAEREAMRAARVEMAVFEDADVDVDSSSGN